VKAVAYPHPVAPGQAEARNPKQYGMTKIQNPKTVKNLASYIAVETASVV